MKTASEALSLMLTVPTIILGAAVIWKWKGSVVNETAKCQGAVYWLILGILISFVGSVIDNAYWGIAWGAHYIGHPSAEVWFENGVYSNIPFRQITGILAAFCHLKSAHSYVREEKGMPIFRNEKNLLVLTAFSFILGWFTVLYLHFL